MAHSLQPDDSISPRKVQTSNFYTISYRVSLHQCGEFAGHSIHLVARRLSVSIIRECDRLHLDEENSAQASNMLLNSADVGSVTPIDFENCMQILLVSSLSNPPIPAFP
ncbi:hypothetical protein V6N11_068827 [Hibiscus sabdariffa]|uniref:Uncharacterized protein n=1 Tax=Hibiscus sabdariffa TaxID=183260 RepID=A0ABR2PAX3_9ROSI